jgi:hypothetical protein
MSSAAEPALSASALAGLIRLRTMLERGLREANDSSEPGRHIALVTLDGACEYAIRFCAHQRGLPLKPDAGFHAGIDVLRKDRGGRKQWRQIGVRGVLELHSARNQTQHMGLLPDRQLMTGWVVDAQAFIEDLVVVSFGVRLEDVLLADAIRDEKLRGLLSEAERQLNVGDYRSAFRYADEALRQARLGWLQQRGSAGQAESKLLFGNTPTQLPRPGDPADQLEVQVFAGDVSPYTQLLTTRHHLETGGPEVDETEARTALMFAFDWVLRWEVFNVGYPAERYAEYWGSVRSPQLDDGGPPQIAWHIESYRLEVGAEREEEYEVLLQLANIPVNDAHDWGLDFPAALASAEQESANGLQAGFHGIDHDGVLRVRVPVSTDLNSLVSVLNRATALATERHQRRDQDMREWRLEALELRDTYATAIQDAVTHGGGVFGEVDVIPQLAGTGVRYIVSIELPSATLSDLNLATSIFSGQGGHLAGSSQQAGRIVFEAFPLEGDGLERLRNAIGGSEGEVLRYRKIAAEHEQERQSFTQEIEGLVGGVPDSTFAVAPSEQDDVG